MATAVVNFSGLVLGDNVFIKVNQFYHGNGDQAQNIETWNVFATVKRTSLDADANAVVVRDSSANITLSGPQATFNLFASETTNFDAGRTYVYDVQSNDPDGFIQTVQRGTLSFVTEVTQRTS